MSDELLIHLFIKRADELCFPNPAPRLLPIARLSNWSSKIDLCSDIQTCVLWLVTWCKYAIFSPSNSCFVRNIIWPRNLLSRLGLLLRCNSKRGLPLHEQPVERSLCDSWSHTHYVLMHTSLWRSTKSSKKKNRTRGSCLRCHHSIRLSRNICVLGLMATIRPKVSKS